MGDQADRAPTATSLRVELFPSDLDAEVRFYTEVLGFVVTKDERDSAWPYVAVRRDAVHIGLAVRADEVDRGSRRPPCGTELVLVVQDLSDEYRQVASVWPLEEDLTARPWGLSDFRVLDPAGYYLRITDGGSDGDIGHGSTSVPESSSGTADS